MSKIKDLKIGDSVEFILNKKVLVGTVYKICSEDETTLVHSDEYYAHIEKLEQEELNRRTEAPKTVAELHDIDLEVEDEEPLTRKLQFYKGTVLIRVSNGTPTFYERPFTDVKKVSPGHSS